MAKEIILDRSDVKSEIHPHLWENFCEQLGISEDSEEMCLVLSANDTNNKTE
jgi:hypothetical protein